MRLVFALCGFGLPLAGCDSSLPGDELGSYLVTKHLAENTCGETAVYQRDGASFRVQLRADDGKSYWRAAGAPPVQGAAVADGHQFLFRSIVARSDQGSDRTCRLAQYEKITVSIVSEEASLDGSMDAAGANAVAATALTGEHVLSIDAVVGDDCSFAVRPTGPFDQLPCTVRYTLEGSETESF